MFYLRMSTRGMLTPLLHNRDGAARRWPIPAWLAHARYVHMSEREPLGPSMISQGPRRQLPKTALICCSKMAEMIETPSRRNIADGRLSV